VADVRFEQATRSPSTSVPAVDALDLHISDGELMVLVGPSGSGKSTALRMIAGLEEVDSGGIWVGGRDVTTAPKDRDVAMVFQNYALYPISPSPPTSASRSRWRRCRSGARAEGA
jgi:multiple sugar transport system ATP-binding protein